MSESSEGSEGSEGRDLNDEPLRFHSQNASKRPKFETQRINF